VTVRQFLAFQKDYEVASEFCPSDDCPVVRTSWYQAVQYCNWLSEQEGLPEKEWCYEANNNGKYEEGMKMAADFMQRTGYRLPTEAEWEYACRAGSTTSRYYGDCDELLPKYGWFMRNSIDRSWPVGSLKPNDLGLFDMHGDVYTWCQDRYEEVTQKGEVKKSDIEDDLVLSEKTSRALRGGGFFTQTRKIRSAYHALGDPKYHGDNIGIRPARTIPHSKAGASD
jgi:formylglycine-generating enzyme required for sulfatase activity